MVGVRQATYVAILLHFARKIVARAAAENPRKLKVRAWLNNGNARLLWTGSPKGSYFAERYLYDEKDKDKAKAGYDIASFYPESIVCDTSYDSAAKTLKCDICVRPGALTREIMMECRAERG